MLGTREVNSLPDNPAPSGTGAPPSLDIARRDFLKRCPAAALACVSAIGATPSLALDYPTNPVRVIVPYPAGGAADVVARMTAKYLGDQLGQQFYIDNRGGAGGTLGTDVAARAAPDGYTLVMHTISSAVLNKFLYPRIKLDVDTQFAPISQIGTVSQLLAVNAAVPARNLQEFIALLKANPGKYQYGSSGLGAIMHLGGELFSFMTGTNVLHVPYRGEGAALVDVLAGRIEFVVASVPAVLSHVRNGEMRALCVNADHRVKLLPDVPTSAEAGLPGYKTYNWYALFAPLGTPEPIVQRLNEALAKALATSEARKQFEDIGIELAASTPRELTAELKQQADFWGPLIERAGVKLD
jgi:tripartite-type tricarboxylate transporter receptor subunit TctC